MRKKGEHPPLSHELVLIINNIHIFSLYLHGPRLAGDLCQGRRGKIKIIKKKEKYLKHSKKPPPAAALHVYTSHSHPFSCAYLKRKSINKITKKGKKRKPQTVQISPRCCSLAGRCVPLATILVCVPIK